MKTVILVPVHNRRELTLQCLHHLHTSGDLRAFDVLVIDAGSSDGTSDAVRAAFPDVAILPGADTWWWTQAIATGMQQSFAAGAPAVVWLNDDVHPHAGTLPALEQFCRENPTTLAAPACIDATGQPVPTAFRGRRSFASAADPVVAVEGVSGFCVCVPKQVWAAAGIPDARRFPHYFGDTGYMLRAQRSGCSVALLSRLHATVHGPRRATSVADFRSLAAAGRSPWRTTFLDPKSPFRLATQWHYLRLRYGEIGGTGLAALRCAVWQLEYAAASLRRRRGI